MKHWNKLILLNIIIILNIYFNYNKYIGIYLLKFKT